MTKMSTSSSPPKARLRRTSEGAQDNILAAAEKILVESGPQNLKLVEVARRAGVVNATVLHHFGSIDGVQAALMTRMIADLVSRILAVTDQVTDPTAFATQSTEALFDAFEAKPVARLAAWLELTGESRRLTTVREAVRSVLSTRMVEQTGMPVAVVEDFILLCLSMALGAGLFGATLGSLLGRSESRARDLALAILQRRVADATLGLKGG
jgi:AcrR family transcriptional regulator